MAEPTEKTIKRLFALSGNICAYPGCNLKMIETAGIVTGEICHIKAKHAGGARFDSGQSDEDRQSFANLILLCRHHHKVIDSAPELYSVDALIEMKSIHENVAGRPEALQDGFFAKVLLNQIRNNAIANNSGNIAIHSPGAMQAQTINVTTTAKKVFVNAPMGTFGSDQDVSRYVQYLIKRYNEFASSDTTRKTKFNFGAISKNIESNFGAKWQLLPIENANMVFEYLQSRIVKTRLAKINKGKGYRTFSTYEEFLSKRGL